MKERDAPQVGGTHYRNTDAQPIDLLTKDEKEGFYKGNIIKYVCRYKDKNGMEDLLKARQYLEWLIELLD